jgi:NAD(P)-dependent dehydrogenase (short-subunit alcohol dehydrogenase family)
MPAYNFSGKVAVVAGLHPLSEKDVRRHAQPGIAEAVMDELLGAGASVIATCHSTEPGEDFKEKHPGDVSYLRLDALNFADFRGLHDYAAGKYGKVDHIVHAIMKAPSPPESRRREIMAAERNLRERLLRGDKPSREELDIFVKNDITPEELERSLTISVGSYMGLIDSLTDLMAPNSSVVTFTFPNHGEVPNYGPTSPVKEELEGIMLRYAEKHAKEHGNNVRFNAVASGAYKSHSSIFFPLIDEYLESARQHSPVKGELTTAGIAKVVMFLLDESSWPITGAIIPADAGARLVYDKIFGPNGNMNDHHKTANHHKARKHQEGSG